MFGGHGLFHEGLMFGIVADGRVYLKVDEENRTAFEDAGTGPFKPFTHKPMTMSYWEVPVAVLDDTEQLLAWAEAARAAAGRANADKPARRRRPGRPRPRRAPA